MTKGDTLIELSKMIDHYLLHPKITDDEIVEGCEISKKFNVATACIKPYCVPMVMELLSGSDVGVCSVIAFPHGNSTIAVKVR